MQSLDTMLSSTKFIYSHQTWPVVRSRRLAPAPLPGCCCRAAAVSVRCQARVKKAKKAAPKRSGFGKSKGFGGKPQEDWESQLLPPYRVYYKQGYKPPRFQGTLKPKVFEDGSVGVVNEKEAVAAEILAISHPVAFLEGSMGVAPPIEDLHVALLEAQLRPSVQKVLNMLPRRPLPPRPTPAAAAAGSQTPAVAGDTAAASSSSSSSTGGPVPAAAAAVVADEVFSTQQLYGGEVPEEMIQLLPTYWDQVQLSAGDVLPLGSKALMRMLQASSWAEEFRDPATSQVRHERAVGFIGVWPEFALLRHSCAPNTSSCVVDRFMLMHATEDVPVGGELTANKLGSVVSSPLAARQLAHLELYGRPCKCRRCTAEQLLPLEVAAELQAVADKAQGEWAAKWQSALEGPSTGALTDEEAAEALTDLQAEISDTLFALDESLLEAVPDNELRLMLKSAVYPAYDLAWQMEELLMGTPDLDKLSSCVALLRMFARGSESHMYSALLLQQAYAARVQELDSKVANMPRKTAAMQRRLTQQINQLLSGANLANVIYSEAVPCRYGIIPDEGLLPQLEEGLSLFYAGLSALSVAQGQGLDEVPEVTRDIVVDGIPVTVTDTVEGTAFSNAAAAEASAAGAAGAGARPRFSIEVLDDAAGEVPASAAAATAAVAGEEVDEEDGEGIDLEAAVAEAVAAAVAEFEAEAAAAGVKPVGRS